LIWGEDSRDREETKREGRKGKRNEGKGQGKEERTMDRIPYLHLFSPLPVLNLTVKL